MGESLQIVGTERKQFIESWGELGSNWGINRTMAQIHALLLLSPAPLCSDDIKTDLGISRGNTCMNIKALLEKELITKCEDVKERKDYYRADKDALSVVKKIVKLRREKELRPLMTLLSTYLNNDSAELDKESNSSIRRHISTQY